MAKKKDYKRPTLMILYWAFYLTVTMAAFEHFRIVPGVVPGKAVGWMLIVEVPRVALGWLIGMPLFKK